VLRQRNQVISALVLRRLLWLLALHESLIHHVCRAVVVYLLLAADVVALELVYHF
jgi:hypothetical protein